MILTAIEAVLTADGVLTSFVGVDSNGFLRVYSSPQSRPPEEQPPFVYFQIIPGPAPTGTYGDGQSMQRVVFQVTSWGRKSQEAWQLDELVWDALTKGDWATYLLPDAPMRISSAETPGELPDFDTRWRQVPRTWNLDLDRG